MALTNGTDNETSEDEVVLRVKPQSDNKTNKNAPEPIRSNHSVYFIHSYNIPNSANKSDPEQDAIRELSQIRSILRNKELDIIRCKSDSRIAVSLAQTERALRTRSVSIPAPLKHNSFIRRSFHSLWGKSFKRKSKNPMAVKCESSSSGSEKLEVAENKKPISDVNVEEVVKEEIDNQIVEKCETVHEEKEEMESEVQLRRRNSTSSSSHSTRSTSSVGFGNRSAPSSPMAPLQGQSEAHGQSIISLNAVAQSPSHQATGSKFDSKSLKHLSAPVTASSNRSISPHPQKSSSTSSKNDGAPEKEKEKKRKELSSSRQKKFHRHFQQVSKDERVINYYSCALVSDILLQGQLYITDNYFAFYSNVFGFVTKLLIPTASVVRISKEKTAKIIPNAVGVATADERHVFGSFMSREAAFRLMCSVCQPLEPVELLPKVPDIEVSEECSVEDDSSCSISGNESPPQAIDSTSDASQSLRQRAIASNLSIPTDCVDGEEKTDISRDAKMIAGTVPALATTSVNASSKTSKSPPPRFISLRTFKIKFPTNFHIVYLGVILTLILTMFSAFLLYRILDFEAKNQNHSSLDFKWRSKGDVDEIYAEALRWQKEMQSRSTEEAQTILNSNLEQIARVRRNLETLSLLIHDRKLPSSQSNSDKEDVESIDESRGYVNTRSILSDLQSEETVDINTDYLGNP